MTQNMLPNLIKTLLHMPEKIKMAEIWLKEVFERQSTNAPFQDSEWERSIKEHGFTYHTYNTTANVLKDVGLVSKDRGVWKLNSLWLVELMKEWNQWLGIEFRE